MSSTSFEQLRNDFPFFSQQENKDIIYFDSAATSHRPQCVISAIENFYKKNNANPMRGLYELSMRATDQYESSRTTIANFVNAKESSEIIFTRNATESLNLIAHSYAMENIHEGDEIAITIMELQGLMLKNN